MVLAETPSPDHGEIDEKPRPKPSITRMKDKAAAAKAPARMAPHETPEPLLLTASMLAGGREWMVEVVMSLLAILDGLISAASAGPGGIATMRL